MNSSLALYDITPPPLAPDCDPIVIGAERQGKEGGGVKSWAPCFSPDSPEIKEFLGLLKRYDGVVTIRDKGKSVGVFCRTWLNKGNLSPRRRMSEILYSGVVVPSLVNSLQDGRYSPSRIKNCIERMSRENNNSKYQVTAGCCG